jgi:hypothetical protein
MSISAKSEARGTRNNAAAMTARAGAMNHRVVSGLIHGEKTMACTTNITTLHSVNIMAIWYFVSPSSCLPRSASPTSKTPIPVETMNETASSLGTSHAAGLGAVLARLAAASPGFVPGIVISAAADARSDRIAVPANGRASDPAAPTIGNTLAPSLATNTPSIGPDRKPLERYPNALNRRDSLARLACADIQNRHLRA